MNGRPAQHSRDIRTDAPPQLYQHVVQRHNYVDSRRVWILPLQSKGQQLHHISIERVMASAAQHMLGMTLCVVHRMVGREEVKLIGYGAHLSVI